jgi:hypothetical protein
MSAAAATTTAGATASTATAGVTTSTAAAATTAGSVATTTATAAAFSWRRFSLLFALVLRSGAERHRRQRSNQRSHDGQSSRKSRHIQSSTAPARLRPTQ